MADANPVTTNPRPETPPAKKHGKSRDLRVNTKQQGPPSDDAVNGDQRRPICRAARNEVQNR